MGGERDIEDPSSDPLLPAAAAAAAAADTSKESLLLEQERKKNQALMEKMEKLIARDEARAALID